MYCFIKGCWKKYKQILCIGLGALIILIFPLFGKLNIYLLGSYHIYPQIAWLLCGFVLFLKGIGINRLIISTRGLEVTLAKAKEVQKNLESTLPILIPIIARIASSKAHAELLPHGGRSYLYNLIQSINKNSFYDNSEKEKLIEDLK